MIKSIFYSEFDSKTGPKIVFQDPEDYISKVFFDINHFYIITKPQLQEKIIVNTIDNLKIIGRPIYIEDPKYDRNAFMFNMCFVCDKDIETGPLEIVVKKLSDYLKELEIEDEALSNIEKKSNIVQWMIYIRRELNNFGMCSLTISNGKMIHLKIAKLSPTGKTSIIHDYDVPVFFPLNLKLESTLWDITMQQILPYLDGFNHIAKLSLLSDVDISFVKDCIGTLIYEGKIKLAPIIQYSNCYMCLPNIHKVMTDSYMQIQCQKYVTTNENFVPNIKDILQVYASLTHGTTLSNICQQYNPRLLKINERKLILFGLLHELIKQVKKYPINTNLGQNSQDISAKNTKMSLEEVKTKQTSSMVKTFMFDGTQSYDAICCKNIVSQTELDEICDELSDTIILHA